jgi:hypothetical protein
LDFFHVGDSLHAAAQAMSTTGETAQAWMETPKDRLKHGQAQCVLDALKPYQENQRIEDDPAPVRVCHRYLSERLKQLHYDDALRQNLPIGSGEIESAHRYLVQQRLKRPGAWWRTHNAEHILAIRLNPANHRWHDYWKKPLPRTSIDHIRLNRTQVQPSIDTDYVLAIEFHIFRYLAYKDGFRNEDFLRQVARSKARVATGRRDR